MNNNAEKIDSAFVSEWGGRWQDERLQIMLRDMDKIPFVRLSVIDAQEDDGTLVVFATNHTAPTFLRMTLEKLWNGPVEVYVGSEILAGV